MKKIGFGVIGCGDVSDRYCEGAQYCPNTKLVMVMDKQKETAKNCGKKYKVPYTDDLQDILNNKDIEAVVVAVPHYLHAPITIQCAEAGKHIMCDKPIAITLEDAKKMIEECDELKVKLTVAFVMRYQSNSLRVKKIIEEGGIGKIIDIKISSFGYKDPKYWTHGYRDKVITDWRGKKKESGGGALIMNLSHHIDLVRFVTGLEVKRVSSEYGIFNSPQGIEVEDTLSAVLRFDNGAIGSISTSMVAHGGGESNISIIGTGGQIVLLAELIKVYTTIDYQGLVTNQWNEIKGEFWAYPSMIEDFARTIIKDREPSVTGEDGLKSLEVVLGIYKSGERAQVVTITNER